MMQAKSASTNLTVQLPLYADSTRNKYKSINPLLWERVKQNIQPALILFLATMPTGSYASTSSWSSEEAPVLHRNTRNIEASSEVSPFSPKSNNIALDLGQVFLMGDLGKYSDSIGTQLHYTYGVSDLFGFDSSIGYSEHASGKYSMVSVLTGLRMNLSWYDKVIPYAVVGLGFYKPSYQDPTSPGSTGPTTAPGIPSTSTSLPSVSSVLFGIHLGPGVDLELSKNLFFGASLTFHNMFSANATLANGTPLSMGGAYTTFFVHLGATF